MNRLPKPTKRNSIEICGQLWHIRTGAMHFGVNYVPALIATRYDDRRQITATDLDGLTRLASRLNPKPPPKSANTAGTTASR